MALPPMYTSILGDLNKAVAREQPEDVLQFCANWFNLELEKQRIAGRASLASVEAAAMAAAQAGRSKSLSAAPPGSAGSSPIKKKGSFTSLGTSPGNSGSGAYSFGRDNPGPPPAGSDRGVIPPVPPMPRDSQMHSGPSGISPFSEAPPSVRPAGGLSSSRNGMQPANLSSSTSGASGISWNRSFGGSSGGLPPAPSSATFPHAGSAPYGTSNGATGSHDSHDSDEEARHSFGESSFVSPRSSQANASGRSDGGIPAGYNLGRRTSVSAESIDPSASSVPLPKTIIPKTASQRARIESSIEKNLLFRNLDEEQHNDVLNAMKEVKVDRGTEVIVQGAVGDFFYVVEQGDFQIWVRPANSQGGTIVSPSTATAPQGLRHRSSTPGMDPETQRDETTTQESGQQVRPDGSKLVATIGPGGSFGELALMYNAPRAATVVCGSPDATLWALDRVTFRTILMEHTSKKRRMYEQFLAEVPILVSLEGYERSKIADALEERVYEEGEDVVREGELGKNFYIIESGRAEVLKKKSDGRVERVGTLSKGDYFGELALLNSAPRAATVRPLPGSGRLRVATLGEKAFTRLLGPVVEILTRRAERNYGIASGGPSAATPTRGSDPSHDLRSPDDRRPSRMMSPGGYKNDDVPPPAGGRGVPVSPRRRQSRAHDSKRDREDIVMGD